MITFDDVTVRYSEDLPPALNNIDLRVEEGELCLLVGATGSGKSTLLGAVNGLVPRFTGGRLTGSVTVAGLDTADHPPSVMAEVVGYVAQDAASGFVTDVVEDELAYVLEQLSLPPNVMRKRVEETLDLLGLSEIRRRPLADLSGGQQQRVALGSVLTAHPRVLVLDEPTSALDPTGAEEVLATIVRIVHDLGTTVLLAEHRLERVIQYADRVAHIHRNGTLSGGDPAEIMATSTVSPPVVDLGRLAGWNPLPLSVRDARRVAPPLRMRLGDPPPPILWNSGQPACLRAARLTVIHHPLVAVREVTLQLAPGEVVGLMGRNGSGKSSLLWALQGTGRRDGGSVEVNGADPAALDPDEARRRVGLVPQTPGDLLYLETVADECSQSDIDAGVEAGTTRELLAELVPGIPADRHPRDLSEGQRLALVLAIQLAASPRVLLLDEPTRGLDYDAKRALGTVLETLSTQDRAIMVATHDVEFAASVATRIVVMSEGEVVADGPAEEVMLASPGFAPQVARILAPACWLTVKQVAGALEMSR